MGYYVSIDSAKFTIPNSEEVTATLKELNTKYDHMKVGGMFGGGGPELRWFSWMPHDYDKDPSLDALRIFELLGFDVDYNDEDETFDIVSYESKIGQEDIFLYAVAPYVSDGCYIEWRGEDGERWRHDVRDGKLWISHGMITYSNRQPVIIPDKPRTEEL